MLSIMLKHLFLKIKWQTAEEMMEGSSDFNSILEKYTDRDNNPLLDSFQIKVTDINQIEEVAKQVQQIENVNDVKYG